MGVDSARRMTCFVPLVILLDGILWTHAYRTGPPLSACKSMFPSGHYSEAQTGISPYNVDLGGAQTYTPEKTLTGKYYKDIVFYLVQYK